MMQMDIYEIRRRNLAQLLSDTSGTIVALAKRTETSANYLTQVLSERTGRRMGSQVARRIENSLDLPEGWMDQIDELPASASPDDVALAQKIRRLPAEIRARIEADIDVLTRYTSLTD